MLNLNMNANFNGSSVKDDVVIAHFNASYNGEKNIYIGISVEDHALFAAHKADVDADFKVPDTVKSPSCEQFRTVLSAFKQAIDIPLKYILPVMVPDTSISP